MESNLAELSIDALRVQYQKLQKYADVVEEKKSAIKTEVKSRMGEQSKIVAGGGYEFQLQHRQIKVYDKPTLRKFFDEDQLELVMTPDNARVTELIKDKEFPNEARIEILESMLVKSESTALILKKLT